MPGSIDTHGRLSLFGSFRLVLDGREIRLASAKERGLLAYLAVEGPEPQPRSHLANLLWGGRSEEQARVSLRQALSGIRRQSGDRILATDKEAVALARDALACDVSEFLALAQQNSSVSLLSATRLFGDFLRGLSIEEEVFAEWQSRTRDRLTQIQIDCLQKLGRRELEVGHNRTAIEFLERAARLDEFREDTHRLIIAALTADGRDAQALRHARGVSDMLQRELGVGLSPATLNLVTSMRRPDLVSDVRNSISSRTDGPADGSTPLRAAGHVGFTKAEPPERRYLPRKPTPAVPKSHRRRRAIIMIAEVAGYTHQQKLARVDRSFDLFRSLIVAYGGEAVNVRGNAVSALFDTSKQAVRLALQVQNEFREQAVWSEGDPIQFRIGIADGEVVENGGNYHGHCVNLAARLQTMADPGGVMATRTVVDAVREMPGVRFRPTGQTALKNLSQVIEVFVLEEAAARPVRIVEEGHPAPAPGPDRHASVAVLKLDNISGDPAMDHLSEGLVADVISNLSRFRNLFVIAQHSAFLFNLRSYSAHEIGRRLGVRYLLGGSLRNAGKRLRVAVELIDAEHEQVIWSDRFDIGLDELIEWQDEITATVASRLAVQIEAAQLRRDPHDTRGYGLVLRGQQLILGFTKEANAHARRLFEEALELAPDFGRAYSAISRTHNLDWRYEWSPSPEASLDAAVDFARRAIERDPLDARGYAELGYAHLYSKRIDESVAEYRRALALNPNDADIIAEYADALVYAEQPENAIEQIERAKRLNPYYPDTYLWYLADAYNAMGRSSDVIATVNQMQNPAEGSRLLAANYAHLGMMEEARAAAAEVMRLHPHFTIRSWRHRPPYRDAGIIERYIEGMRKAGLPE